MPTMNTNAILVGLLYGALTGIINVVFSQKSQIEAYASANPRLAAIGKLLRAIGFDPQNFWAFLTLIFAKVLPAAQRSDSPIAIREEAKAEAKALAADQADETVHIIPPSGPSSAALILVVAFSWHTQACSAAKSLPCDEAQLSAIDAGYIAETLAACRAYPDKDSCPAWPALRDKHAADLRKACPQ